MKNNLTKLVTSTCAAILLTACATTAPTSMSQAPVAAYRDVIDLAGRLSVNYEKDGKPETLSGKFNWSQKGERIASGRVVAGVHALRGPDDPLSGRFTHETVPALRKAGAASIAVLVTDTSPNAFPQLPVREGEPVLVWFAAFADPATADAAQGLFPEPSIQRLRLEPTARSRLHG